MEMSTCHTVLKSNVSLVTGVEEACHVQSSGSRYNPMRATIQRVFLFQHICVKLHESNSQISSAQSLIDLSQVCWSRKSGKPAGSRTL